MRAAAAAARSLSSLPRRCRPHRWLCGAAHLVQPRWLSTVVGQSPPLSPLSSSTHDVPVKRSLGEAMGSGPSRRDLAIEELSFDVFGRGNQHLKNVETLTSLPEGLHSFPEVCFIGKPSCGKSSLISCLLHNRRLGKTGQVRGTTRLLQFFNVGDALLLVDTPGYGGWRGRRVDCKPKDRANAFAILFRYLALRKGGNLKRVYWCMEATATTPMNFTPRDEEIFAFLSREGIAFTVVLTKIDRHFHYFREQHRHRATISRDGVPNPPPWQGRLHAVRDGVEDSRDVPPTPAEGIARNMAEICDFLGSPAVPIIGVSANRWHPERCMNLTEVQHDIVDHCSRELATVEQLTYAHLHNLSYAPPRAEDISRVQRTYPVEAFVVPQDDRLSLQEMVDRHEAAKAHLLASSSRFSLLSAKDAAEGFLNDSRELQAIEEAEDRHRELLDGLPPALTIATQPPPSPRLLECDAPQRLRKSEPLPPHVAAGAAHERRRGFSPRPRLHEEPADPWESLVHAEETDGDDAGDTAEAPQGAHLGPSLASSPPPVDTAAVSATATAAAAGGGSAWGVTVATPSMPDPLPFSIDREAQTVTAINGVRIPRSLVPASVEDLAIEKEDEVAAFALKSGAGAYEEMLIHDHLHPDTPAGQTFMETSPMARLSDEELATMRRPMTKSAARKQSERLLRKFVDKERKDRSIYMQAEGFMCPWVGSPATSGSVVGLAGTAHAPSGRSGALMKGLKKSGFGGKSYSARTLRGKGRGTKKTGSWAA